MYTHTYAYTPCQEGKYTQGLTNFIKLWYYMSLFVSFGWVRKAARRDIASSRVV